MLLTDLVIVNPSKSKTASLAATLSVTGDELALMPEDEYALRPSELDRLNAFAVPVLDFKTKARPPEPDVSTVVACIPEISLILSTRPWTVLFVLSIVITVLTPAKVNVRFP